ncbi:MAG: Protein phosphatase 2C-like protein [Proteobacteria bacterium]|nr:Protein phosphatase 2C-like protein [Pseudomonadota bacterium]
MGLGIDACFAQHLGDRKEQQDRVAIMPHPKVKGVAVAVVADGMGGHTGGALAAEQVIHTVRNNLGHFSPSEDPPQKLIEGSILEAHTMIKAARCMNEKDPHSTVVIMLLQPGRVSWGYCGDSRFYRFQGDRLAHRSVDHSYVEHLIETGQIKPEEALTHPYRNVLITSLGGDDLPKMTFGEVTDLADGDCYLLCSDGLWAYFTEAELGGVLAAFSAREACEVLIKRARDRCGGEGDNVSLAIIKLKAAEVPKPKVPPPRI